MQSSTLVFVVVLIACLSATAFGQQKGGGSCDVPGGRPLPCPSYTFTQPSDRIEKRTYDPFNIISIEELTPNFIRAIETALPDLDAYLHGANTGKQTLTRQIPTAVGVRPSVRQAVTTSWILGANITSPPSPTDANITVTPIPAGSTLYSRTFYAGFFNDDGPVIEEVVNLARELTTLKLPYDNTTFVFGDYDPITVRDNRRYEVWLFPTSEAEVIRKSPIARSTIFRRK